MEYNVIELRKNLREALNKVDAGEAVIVTRYGKQYRLVAAGGAVAPMGPTHNIPKKETPKKISDPKLFRQEYPSALPLCKHGAYPKYCKYAKNGKPCKEK